MLFMKLFEIIPIALFVYDSCLFLHIKYLVHIKVSLELAFSRKVLILAPMDYG